MMDLPLLAQTVIGNYSRMGDVAVVATCIIIFVLLMCSYVVRSKSFRIFVFIVGLVFFAAIINIGVNSMIDHPELLKNNPYLIGLVYILRTFYHVILFNVFFAFTLYAVVVSEMPKKQARLIAIVATVLFAAAIAVDVVLTMTGVGFKISKDTGEIISGSNVFMIGYTAYIIFLGVLLFRLRKLIYKRVLWGFFLTMVLSAIIRYGQMIIKESSLTTLTFLLPTLPMLYFMHVNPYNLTTGTLDGKAMEDMIKTLYSKKKSFIIMSLYLPDFVGEGKTLPEVVKEQTRRFIRHHFRDGTLFQPRNGQILMVAKKETNPDYNSWMQSILNAFQEQYNVHKMPYKIVFGDSFENEINENEYLSLIDSIHATIQNNITHRIEEADIARFKQNKYIVEQLEDIYKKNDLDDPRVLVYCQPVFNIETKRFDTAEALMRLDLEKTGIVSPLVFIPIAERLGYIHVLTKIILNKACKTLHDLQENGIEITRISVNASSLEIKDDDFCRDVNRILYMNGVPGYKIALELTESQNEEDFLIMKERMEILHEEGIQFYLDDFGTGYSNMERILELPFDIIKFDRSMVIASAQDSRSEHIVEKLARMFSDFNYHVLFEGVENNEDEDRCLSMAASYLQGFKYSKPIPIEQLHGFLTGIN